ncbi:MAG: hypothetical protein COA82_02375 [Alkaliphilus sp.]|nr:MAG: hypothetical protein COA82_02375 [Alkaliphilus sp.]
MYEQRSVASVIILTILTCGIYGLYWLYITSKDLEMFLGESGMSPGLELFVMIICAPYVLYWYYDKSQKIADAYEKVGMPRKDDSLACLILGIFGLGIISMAIMQSNLNTIWVNESRM